MINMRPLAGATLFRRPKDGAPKAKTEADIGKKKIVVVSGAKRK